MALFPCLSKKLQSYQKTPGPLLKSYAFDPMLFKKLRGRFQLANSTPPLSVTDSAIAPSARMPQWKFVVHIVLSIATSRVSVAVSVWPICV